MRTIGNLKGLRDARTSISTHHRTVARQKGTPYLEILSMGMEKIRLEANLEQLGKQRRRIETRLGEIRELLNDRLAAVQEGGPPLSDEASRAGSSAGGGGSSAPASMKTMSIGY